jgi:hypothetical protein
LLCVLWGPWCNWLLSKGPTCKVCWLI